MTLYECKYCLYTTIDNSNYKKHLKTNRHIQNIGQSDFTNQDLNCIFCKKNFKRKYHLKRHLNLNCFIRKDYTKYVDGTMTSNTILKYIRDLETENTKLKELLQLPKEDNTIHQCTKEIAKNIYNEHIKEMDDALHYLDVPKNLVMEHLHKIDYKLINSLDKVMDLLPKYFLELIEDDNTKTENNLIPTESTDEENDFVEIDGPLLNTYLEKYFKKQNTKISNSELKLYQFYLHEKYLESNNLSYPIFNKKYKYGVILDCSKNYYYQDDTGYVFTKEKPNKFVGIRKQDGQYYYIKYLKDFINDLNSIYKYVDDEVSYY